MAIGDKKPVVMECDQGISGGVATLGTDGRPAEDQRPDYAVDQVTGLQDALGTKQDKILMEGLLKGNGSGSAAAAMPGEDFSFGVSDAPPAVYWGYCCGLSAEMPLPKEVDEL